MGSGNCACLDLPPPVVAIVEDDADDAPEDLKTSPLSTKNPMKNQREMR
jgi:hypothetical protein